VSEPFVAFPAIVKMNRAGLVEEELFAAVGALGLGAYFLRLNIQQLGCEALE